MAITSATAAPATMPPTKLALLLPAPLTVSVGVAVAEVSEEDTSVVVA